MNTTLLIALMMFVMQETTFIWKNKDGETPAKHIEVVYHEGNAYLLLESGKEYEPYISFRKPNREIFQLGVQLGGAGDDFVLYSLPMHSIVQRTDPRTGDLWVRGGVTIGGSSRIDAVVVINDTLFMWVNGKKFKLSEAK